VLASSLAGSIRMPWSEIEMYIAAKRSLALAWRDFTVTGLGTVLLAGLLGLAPAAIAASPTTPLFADRELGDPLVQAVGSLGLDAKSIELLPQAAVAACATMPGPAPRLALLAHTPSRAELDRCAQAAAAEVNVVEVGRQAVALVVPMSSPVWNVD